jgi:alkanesulfonate monooxygenase SsuD/methylene tetrahydromethanopterin reductase-like flavin-dependent oxidoreductase (luciferase family)
VAEEVAVLDRLSQGRVILGMGRGFRGALFTAFEVPAKEKLDRFDAALLVMRRAWAGEPVAWEDGIGEGTDPTPVRVSPLPVQQPHPPLWVAAFGPKAVAQAARLGLPYLASPIESLAVLEANYERHRAGLAESGHTDPVAVPVMRTLFVARDVRLLARAHAGLTQQAAALAKAPAASLRRAAAASVADWAIVGEPSEVAEQVARQREKLGITHLIARVQIPGLAREEILASLQELAALTL